MNSFNGTGRLTRPPELQYSKDGKPWCKFSMAINRRFQKDKTDFLNCVCFGKTAEFVANYGDKGRLVEVTGSVQVENYTDKEGNKRTSTEIIADNVSYLDKQASGAGTGNQASGTRDPWEDLGREVRLEDVSLTAEEDISS